MAYKKQTLSSFILATPKLESLSGTELSFWPGRNLKVGPKVCPALRGILLVIYGQPLHGCSL
jgi:hypothetical protein